MESSGIGAKAASQEKSAQVHRWYVGKCAGTRINANKLIRKYIPKEANFEDFSERKILNIQKKLNRRPREKLNFKSPKECFFCNFL